MKYSLVFLSVFFAVFFKSQNLADYKYIVVPDVFVDFKGKYKLEPLLAEQLKLKQYKVLSQDQSTWDENVLLNPCDVIKADVFDDGGLLRNKIVLNFSDCKKNKILVINSSSNIKEYEAGFKDALKKSFTSIPYSNSKVEQQKIPENAISKEAQVFSYGENLYNKVILSENQFVLIDKKSASLFAKFFKTSKSDIYRVIFENNNSAFAYFENGNIILDIDDNKEGFKKEKMIFVK